MKKEIINGTTGEVQILDLTDAEVEQYKNDMPQTDTEETTTE